MVPQRERQLMSLSATCFCRTVVAFSRRGAPALWCASRTARYSQAGLPGMSEHMRCYAVRFARPQFVFICSEALRCQRERHAHAHMSLRCSSALPPRVHDMFSCSSVRIERIWRRLPAFRALPRIASCRRRARGERQRCRRRRRLRERHCGLCQYGSSGVHSSDVRRARDSG